ncbi:hisitdine kinase [Anopheles sinensis]|uniref:Hisitdine kinase n=1 Tax=Anopheles sinensis TaxID=74873 RepID=A0A084WQ12_ANOSI|nr:hisitdine kinase [Anopheles sinensis]
MHGSTTTRWRLLLDSAPQFRSVAKKLTPRGQEENTTDANREAHAIRCGQNLTRPDKQLIRKCATRSRSSVLYSSRKRSRSSAGPMVK